MEVVVTRYRNGKPYTRRLRGHSHYYFRAIGDLWECGCWASPEAQSTPGVKSGERYLWGEGEAERVLDTPALPGWADCKLADGPPWPWERY